MGIKYDPFAAVLGHRRGKQQSDSILSLRASDSGREDLKAYLAEMQEHNFARTLGLLSANHSLIGERPLLGQLASEFCRYLVGESALHFDDAVRHFLDATGVYPRLSDYLVLVGEQRRLRGQAAQGRSLHIWPQGRQVGPLACLEGSSEAVCGLKVNRVAWRRVDRGTWQSEGLAELDWKTCDACGRNCPSELKYVLEESSRYIPFGAELYTRMLRTVAQRTVSQLTLRRFETVEDASELANRSYRATLLPAAVAYACQAGEASVQWVLERRDWQALRRDHGSELHSLLTAGDWKEALAPCVPRLSDGQLLQASDDELARARQQLSSLLRERVERPSLKSAPARKARRAP